MYQELTHWKHMPGNTFLACAAPFHIWKVTRAKESMFGLTSVPLRASDYLVSDWLSMALSGDDSKPERPGAAIMEADDRHSNRHSTTGTRQTQYQEVFPSSANVQSHLTASFAADDGKAS